MRGSGSGGFGIKPKRAAIFFENGTFLCRLLL